MDEDVGGEIDRGGRFVHLLDHAGKKRVSCMMKRRNGWRKTTHDDDGAVPDECPTKRDELPLALTERADVRVERDADLLRLIW